MQLFWNLNAILLIAGIQLPVFNEEVEIILTNIYKENWMEILGNVWKLV